MSQLTVRRGPARPGYRSPVRRLTAGLASLALGLGTLGLAAPPANAASRSLATNAEYNQIRQGQTLAQVNNIIDSRGQSVGDGTYVWKATQGRRVVVFFVNGRAGDKARFVVASLSEYRKIDRGDRYSRVKKIIGGRSLFSLQDQDDEFRTRVWLSPDLSRTITVVFNDNGRVVAKDRSSTEDLRVAFR